MLNFFQNKKDFFPSAMCLSFLAHGLALGVGGVLLSSLPTHVSVNQGEQSIEVVLLEDSVPKTEEHFSRENKNVDQVKGNDDFVPMKQEIDNSLTQSKANEANDKTNTSFIENPHLKSSISYSRMKEVLVHTVPDNELSEGAVVQNNSKDFNNPAPVYPSLARERGWEGIVSVAVLVEQDGLPSKLVIEESSGYDVLDQAALKAMGKWQFKAARKGPAVLSSWISIPIRFKLIDQ